MTVCRQSDKGTCQLLILDKLVSRAIKRAEGIGYKKTIKEQTKERYETINYPLIYDIQCPLTATGEELLLKTGIMYHMGVLSAIKYEETLTTSTMRYGSGVTLHLK